jgi:hypothetical protein
MPRINVKREHLAVDRAGELQSSGGMSSSTYRSFAREISLGSGSGCNAGLEAWPRQLPVEVHGEVSTMAALEPGACRAEPLGHL